MNVNAAGARVAEADAAAGAWAPEPFVVEEAGGRLELDELLSPAQAHLEDALLHLYLERRQQEWDKMTRELQTREVALARARKGANKGRTCMAAEQLVREQQRVMEARDKREVASLVDLVAPIAKPSGRITSEAQQLMQRNWAEALEGALADAPGLRAANGEWVVDKVLRRLPASLPTSKLAQAQRVPGDDPRVALRGQWGLYARAPTPACHFLGMYRGRSLLVHLHERRVKGDPATHGHAGMNIPTWKLNNEAYAADKKAVDLAWLVETIRREGLLVEGLEELLDGWDGSKSDIEISAWGCSNAIALMNDSHVDPLSSYRGDTGTAQVVEMWFGHKTFLPAFTLQDVVLGGEFSYDYGEGFWDTTAGPLMKQMEAMAAQQQAEAAQQKAEQEAERLRREMAAVAAAKDEENRQLRQQLQELRAHVDVQRHLRPPSQATDAPPLPQQPAPAAAGLQEWQHQPGQPLQSGRARSGAGMGGRPGRASAEVAGVARALELRERCQQKLDEARSMWTAARLEAAPPTQQYMEIDVEADGEEVLEEAQEDEGAAQAALDRACQRLSEVREVRRQKAADAAAKLRAFRALEEQLGRPEWELEGLAEQQSFMQLVHRPGDLPHDARVRRQGGDWQLLRRLERKLLAEHENLQLVAAVAKETEVLEEVEEAAAAAQVEVADVALRVAQAAAALRNADAAVAQAKQEAAAAEERGGLECQWAEASADEEMLDAPPPSNGGEDDGARPLAAAAEVAEVGSGQWQASDGGFQALPAAAHLQPAVHQLPDADDSKRSADISITISSSSSEDGDTGTNAAVNGRRRRSMTILRAAKPVWHPASCPQAAAAGQPQQQQIRQGKEAFEA